MECRKATVSLLYLVFLIFLMYIYHVLFFLTRWCTGVQIDVTGRVEVWILMSRISLLKGTGLGGVVAS